MVFSEEFDISLIGIGLVVLKECPFESGVWCMGFLAGCVNTQNALSVTPVIYDGTIARGLSSTVPMKSSL